MFVETQSADKVKAGIAAMRFKSKGGTRSDDVAWRRPSGHDRSGRQTESGLWPLNPDGELLNWTIVESKEAWPRARDPQVKASASLAGAGTCAVVRRPTPPATRPRTVGWENAIQQVLVGVQGIHVRADFPSTPADIEMRMKQGFSVFVMNWGDPGFKAVDLRPRRIGR